MNSRQVIIFWVIAIALGGAVAAVKLTQKPARASATERAPGQTLLESFPAAEVTSVEIQGASGVVTLVKHDSQWSVVQRDGYPANANYINDFLRTLGEVKVTRGLEAGVSFAGRFGMNETSTVAAERGLTAAMRDGTGREVARVSLGKSIEGSGEGTAMGGNIAVGRYVRNHADPSGFYAVSEMFPAVSADVVRWLANDFINPEKIQSITLSDMGVDTPAWRLSRQSEDAEFQLEGAAPSETLATTVATPLKSLFAYARFEDVVTADQARARGDASGQRHARIETFEGISYALTLTPARAGADHYYLTVTVAAELPKERKKEAGEKPEDAQAKERAFSERVKTLGEKLAKEKALAGRTFEVAKSTVEPLVKERAQLMAKPPELPAAGSNNGGVSQLPGGLIARPPTASPPPVALPDKEAPGQGGNGGGKKN